jgi:c-di-GMP-binding flagellar brake protein YcgR
MTEPRVPEVLTHVDGILRHDMTMFLQRKGSEEDMKLPIRVVGWVAGKFFLTTCPYENGMRLKLESGTSHGLIYLNKGNVYGFRTHLFREINTMVPLLLFSYPDEVERVELRKEPRYSTLFAADIGSESDGVVEVYKGTIVNLSKSGCLMKLRKDTAWQVGHEATATFEMPTDNREYSLKCVLRAIKRSKDGETLGLEFQEVPEEFNKQIDVVASVAEEAT